MLLYTFTVQTEQGPGKNILPSRAQRFTPDSFYDFATQRSAQRDLPIGVCVQIHPRRVTGLVLIKALASNHSSVVSAIL